MDYKYSDLMKMINHGIEPMIMYSISKEEVEQGDVSRLVDLFKVVTRLGGHAKQKCVITCGGYDDIPDELYEIPEVRKYVNKMFTRIPYMLYYINIQLEAEHWLLSSLADEVTSVVQGDAEILKMNAHELFERYGIDTPKTKALLTFKGGNLSKILKPIIAHGKKIGDPEGAKELAIEYAYRFDHAERTLEEMGIRSWRR